jgi:hypothetical protein
MSQAAIDQIVDRIAARFSPERIVLFGSHARGDAREGSDLDLMVLFREVNQDSPTCGAALQAARRFVTGATGGLPTRRRIQSCPTLTSIFPLGRVDVAA